MERLFLELYEEFTQRQSEEEVEGYPSSTFEIDFDIMEEMFQ